MLDRDSYGRRNVTFDSLQNLSKNGSSVHFVGIGGVSMYSLARLALNRGAVVSGSDREENERTGLLSEIDIPVFIGHSKEHVKGKSLVVYSHAISDDNPELLEARERGIPTANRAEFLGALMLSYKNRIGVSGTHGKSTTVAMLDSIFSYAMVNPTVLSGADLPSGDSIKIGSDALLIYEACEYRDSFLKFSPSVAIGLNLELDHTDYFADINAIKESFVKSLSRARDFALISGDDKNLRDISAKIKTRVVTFGRNEGNTYRYFVSSFDDSGFDFTLSKYGSKIGSFRLNIPGVFNIHNATAAIVTALEYGIDVEHAIKAINDFRGIPRRLEFLGEFMGRPIYYDYAHHPTEIRASISALKMICKTAVTVIFKPHTYTRTQSLWDETCQALSLADHLILTDIYPAREKPIFGITSENLALAVGDTAVYCSDDNAVDFALKNTKGAIVLMGAGDLGKIKSNLMR